MFSLFKNTKSYYVLALFSTVPCHHLHSVSFNVHINIILTYARTSKLVSVFQGLRLNFCLQLSRRSRNSTVPRFRNACPRERVSIPDRSFLFQNVYGGIEACTLSYSRSKGPLFQRQNSQNVKHKILFLIILLLWLNGPTWVTPLHG